MKSKHFDCSKKLRMFIEIPSLCALQNSLQNDVNELKFKSFNHGWEKGRDNNRRHESVFDVPLFILSSQFLGVFGV